MDDAAGGICQGVAIGIRDRADTEALVQLVDVAFGRGQSIAARVVGLAIDAVRRFTASYGLGITVRIKNQK